MIGQGIMLYIRLYALVYSKPSQASKMEDFGKKHSTLDI